MPGVAALAGRAAPAQRLGFVLRGSPADGFGAAVAALGDVDGDGFTDVAVGAPDAAPGGRVAAGRVTVFAGVNGAAARVLDGAFAGDRFGAAIAGLGDVDGDGAPDLLVGAPGAFAGRGAIVVISGASGAIVQAIPGAAPGDTLGSAVAAVGDLDGDRRPDALAGAPGARAGRGAAFVVSSAGGGVLHAFLGSAAGDAFGAAVAGLGDVDGDGVADLAVGAPDADLPGRVDGGAAFVYSGASGARIRVHEGPGVGIRLGAAVAGAGDFDGDGTPDLAVGVPRFDAWSGHGWIADTGAVFLYSGASGAYLGKASVYDRSAHLGSSLASAGDLDGDGVEDLLIGAPGAAQGAGRGYVFLASRTLLPGVAGGGAAVAGGDVNGDRVPDLVVGAPAAGTVRVASGVQSRRPGLRIWTRDGEREGDVFGAAIAGVGDLDGDGTPDVLVGAPLADPQGRDAAGRAFVVSGATGAVHLALDGGAAGDAFGSSVAGLGDVDSDGTPDFAVGAPSHDPPGRADAGRVTVFSGNGGGALFAVDGERDGDRFGYAIAAAGDADGDGLGDLLVGAPYARWNGRGYVLSAATGRVLHRIDGVDPAERLGFAVAGLGDVDRDGVADAAFGAPWGGFRSAGRVSVVSLATGAQLRGHVGDTAWGRFGVALTGTPDIDGDGVADLLVGAPGAEVFGSRSAGAAILLSGADGARLSAHFGTFTDEQLGSAVGSVGDLDGDGVPELVVGNRPGMSPLGLPRPPRVRVLSGATGAELYLLDGTHYTDLFGAPVAALGDVDGDGVQDLAVGMIGADPVGRENAGRVIVFAGAGIPAGVRSTGSGCPLSSGAVPAASTLGVPFAGNLGFAIVVANVPDGVPALLLVGASDRVWQGRCLPLDLGFVGLPGCLLRVAPDATLPVSTVGRIAAARLPVVWNPALVGVPLFAQCFVVDPGAGLGAMSNALELRVLPF